MIGENIRYGVYVDSDGPFAMAGNTIWENRTGVMLKGNPGGPVEREQHLQQHGDGRQARLSQPLPGRERPAPAGCRPFRCFMTRHQRQGSDHRAAIAGTSAPIRTGRSPSGGRPAPMGRVRPPRGDPDVAGQDASPRDELLDGLRGSAGDLLDRGGPAVIPILAMEPGHGRGCTSTYGPNPRRASTCAAHVSGT